MQRTTALFPAMVLALLLASVTPAQAFFDMLAAHRGLSLSGGSVAIPVADLKTDEARFYKVKTGGKEIKFFAVRTADGKVRTAFDACDVCWPSKKGYKQDGQFMICVNCGQKFHLRQVGDVYGGCNPSPLASAVQGDKVVVTEAALGAGAKYF